MNDETATMTITFPPDYPWRHLVFEGEEETNVAKTARDGTSSGAGATSQPPADGGSEKGLPLA